MSNFTPGPWVTVTKEVFFATVGQLNVHPRSERERTFWETPRREVLGITTPGYLGIGAHTYSVHAALAKAGASAMADATRRNAA